jgi:hypothetical protein
LDEIKEGKWPDGDEWTGIAEEDCTGREDDTRKADLDGVDEGVEGIGVGTTLDETLGVPDSAEE